MHIGLIGGIWVAAARLLIAAMLLAPADARADLLCRVVLDHHVTPRSLSAVAEAAGRADEAEQAIENAREPYAGPIDGDTPEEERLLRCAAVYQMAMGLRQDGEIAADWPDFLLDESWNREGVDKALVSAFVPYIAYRDGDPVRACQTDAKRDRPEYGRVALGIVTHTFRYSREMTLAGCDARGKLAIEETTFWADLPTCRGIAAPALRLMTDMARTPNPCTAEYRRRIRQMSN